MTGFFLYPRGYSNRPSQALKKSEMFYPSVLSHYKILTERGNTSHPWGRVIMPGRGWVGLS